MNKNFYLWAIIALFAFNANAQSERTPSGHVRCFTTEAEAERRAENKNLESEQQFENWLAPKVQEMLARQASGERMAVTTIPIVFHVIHDGEAVGTGNNISAALVNAQIDQLNQDFRKFGAGANSSSVGADTEIEFCPATLDPNGNAMAEPGIDRVNSQSKGWGTSPFGACVGQSFDRSEIENTVKPQSIWNPDEYLNIWVMEMSCGILGYAQFPSSSGLQGFSNNEGGASTDGVAVIPSSLGSVANPNPAGGNYNKGRTLTHEIGHWIGLRHIWGDGGCSVDDFVNDTPTSDGANYGCSATSSCGSTDMIENYMDYSDDACMNIFTFGQKARMDAVLANSPRRGSLASSTKCGSTPPGDTQAPSTPTNLTASNIAETTATLTWNASSDNVGVVGYDVALNGNVLGTVTGTSANLTGLVANTAYTATVVAKDAAGNTSGTATTSFTTTGSTGSDCAGADLVLSITFDNYPEETSWAITNSAGSTVASGGTYASQPDGSTLTQNINLPNGNYTFTINDSYGDGICCSYGSGSYALTAGGETIASGGSFTNSDATEFCVEGSGPTPDTQAPSTPGNVTASNIAQTTATIAWSASTDNVGVEEYNVYLNGSLVGTTSGTSTNLTGLTAGTSYTVGVSAVDAAGNASAQGTTTFTTQSVPTSGTDDIFAHYFESGLDGWVDGGSDCYRYSSTSRAWEGRYSIRLRDNSGTASSMTLNNVDVSGYDELELKFYFYPNSMENGEDFWVRVNDGSGWQTVASYASGTSFNNGSFYSATIVLNASDYSFNSGFDFRIQCDASANADQVYIDEVTLKGTYGSSRVSSNSLVKVGAGQPTGVVVEQAAKVIEESTIDIYPNPVVNELTLASDFESAFISIYNLNGGLVKQTQVFAKTSTIDVSDLQAGTYIIQVQNDKDFAVSKFIKY